MKKYLIIALLAVTAHAADAKKPAPDTQEVSDLKAQVATLKAEIDDTSAQRDQALHDAANAVIAARSIARVEQAERQELAALKSKK